MCFPGRVSPCVVRWSWSGKQPIPDVDHFVHVSQPADLSLVLNCCSHWHVRNARKRGEGKKHIYLPALSSNLCPPATACASARHPGRLTNTHTSTSIHSDAARRILLDVTAGSRVIPHLQFLRYSGENRNKFPTKRRCERTHATVRLRGEASSVWKQQDRLEVKEGCTDLKEQGARALL